MQSFVTPTPQAMRVVVVQNGTTSFPRLAILATVIGTILAVSSTSSELQSEWALFFPALFISVGLLIAPLSAAVRDPKSILRGEHLLSVGVIYWVLLDLLQGSYSLDTVSLEEINKAFVGIGIFVGTMWMGASYHLGKIPNIISRSTALVFSGNTYFLLAVISFFIAMLTFAIPTNFNVIEMFRYLGENRWDAFLDHLQYFGYLLPAFTVIVARHTSWINKRTVVSAIMSLIIMAFLMQGGGRRIIGVLVGTALILWLLTEPKLRIRHGVIATIGVIVLLIVMQLMVEYRGEGFSELFVKKEQSEQIFRRDKLHIDDNFYRLCQIMQFIPESYPYVYHQYVVWVMVRPIPRILWAGKPVDPGFDLPKALGVEGVSYTSSVLGELYMSAGLIGIALGGLFYGRLASIASRLLTTGKTFGSVIIYSILIMALFVGLRSMLELVLISYVILAWIGLSRVATYFRNFRIV
jgi:oligosaccharide repeat unit polymerase